MAQDIPYLGELREKYLLAIKSITLYKEEY
jgi:hypothetical protein